MKTGILYLVEFSLEDEYISSYVIADGINQAYDKVASLFPKAKVTGVKWTTSNIIL